MRCVELTGPNGEAGGVVLLSEIALALIETNDGGVSVVFKSGAKAVLHFGNLEKSLKFVKLFEECLLPLCT